MALNDFQKLTADILLHVPAHARSGELVILCTWMGAADKHVAKYIELYKKQTPASRILLLKSGISSMISSYSSQQKAIAPAMSPILDVLEQCKQSELKILLHIFSNGGINTATHLLIELNRRRNKPTPLIGLICDSVPTGAGYKKSYKAFMYSVPQSFPVKQASAVMVHTLLVILYLSIAMGRYEAPEDFWRKAILDKNLVDSKRICYIASKTDKLTDWNDVLAHAETARREGWKTKEIIFDETAHCNHLKEYPKVYHDAVYSMAHGMDFDIVSSKL